MSEVWAAEWWCGAARAGLGLVGGVASIVGECTGVVVAPELRLLWLLEKEGDQGVTVVQKRRCRRSTTVADMT